MIKKPEHIAGYHAHVYYTVASRNSAARLKEKILKELGESVIVHELIDEPIGPHPLPMFEIDIPPQNVKPVFDWLDKNHGDHSILVHPLSGDDLADHRDFPQWIGQPQTLDLEFLKRFRRH